MKVTAIAFGLEKQYLHRHQKVRLLPHHLSFAAISAGILCGSCMPLSASGIICLIIAIDLIIIAICLHQAISKPNAGIIAIWLVSWMVLWISYGILAGQPHPRIALPQHTSCEIQGIITEIQPGSSQITARLNHYRCGSLQSTDEVQIRMRLQPHESSAGLARGTAFSATGRFEPFEAPDVPGMFDNRSWAKIHAIDCMFVRRPQDALTILHPANGIIASLEKARHHAYQILCSHSPHGLLPALVLGASRAISDDTRATFAQLGIAHVLAVSGLHFGIVALVISFIFARIASRSKWIMRRFGRRRFAVAAAMPVLMIYLLFVGAPVSAQRSLLMMTLCCLAHLFCRKSERTRTLAIAGMLILIADPNALFSIAFQLSFSAILGIIQGMHLYDLYIQPKLIELNISDKMRKCMAALCSMCVMTLSTSVTTAPFVIAHFGMLPVTGIAANLIVIPYVSFILMPVSIITAIALISGLPFAVYPARLCGFFETLIVDFANDYSEYIPFTYTEMPATPLVLTFSVLAAFAVLFYFRPSKPRILATLAITFLTAAVLIISSIYPRIYHLHDDLRISSIAMGQADATLIEFPNGHIMVIDIGSEIQKDANAGQTRMLPYLQTLGIRHIDTLILTHGDYDHIAGIQPVIESCSIGEVWVNQISTEEMPTYQRYIQSKDIPIVPIAKLPSHQRYGEVDLDIYWPDARGTGILQELGTLNENERSVVIGLGYHRFSALFMGDAGVAVEEQMLEMYKLKPVTILKAGHHGSNSASSQPWVDTIRPRAVIFSVGKRNRYHFPHKPVRDRFSGIQSSIYRTDLHGTIRFSTDGYTMQVETMR